MKEYSIGEVCALFDVKPHVIRYWEKIFPFLRPKRGRAGRRVYRERELQLFFRMKYLLHQKNLSLEQAKQKIWREITDKKIDLKIHIQQLRGELLELFERLPLKKSGMNDR